MIISFHQWSVNEDKCKTFSYDKADSDAEILAYLVDHGNAY